MYQQITIVGNVGQDPEMRYTSEGAGVCNFSVAVNKRRKDRNTNEYTDQTTWFRVAAWRNLAEVCSQYVHKGMLVMVVGEIKADSYVGQDGQTRVTLEITARDVKFLSRRSDGDGGDGGGYSGGGGGSNYAADNVDDIPF